MHLKKKPRVIFSSKTFILEEKITEGVLNLEKQGFCLLTYMFTFMVFLTKVNAVPPQGPLGENGSLVVSHLLLLFIVSYDDRRDTQR